VSNSLDRHPEGPINTVARRVIDATGDRDDADAVVVEMPVSLAFNDISFAVMMATPTDLEDFIIGFAIGEGIVRHAQEIFDVDIEPTTNGWVVNARISNEAAFRLKEHRRTMAGPSGCGLCGVESLEQIKREVRALPGVELPTANAISAATEAFRPLQLVAGKTSGAHAAAWCDYHGEIIALREDVGRHNALDKLIGWRAKADQHGFAMVSSRASFELVTKAATAGIAVLTAMSAPTSMAIQAAQQSNLTLIAFASRGRYAIYS
jgi:FdhD protein